MKQLLTILVVSMLVSFKPPVETDYQKVFGDRYTRAVNWLNKNEALFNEYATAFNIPGKELKAIVFPELIRYNSMMNALEVESLKFLYVREGKEYADFSVGYFQMKPSFAEMVEQDAMNVLPERYRELSGWRLSSRDTEYSRKARVNRLSNVHHQLIYLCAFYKICENRFRKRRFNSIEERLKLFATCYNAGYKRDEQSLFSYLSKKHFYHYNYASVSAFYYLQQ